jgi:hypothetical protein
MGDGGWGCLRAPPWLHRRHSWQYERQIQHHHCHHWTRPRRSALSGTSQKQSARVARVACGTWCKVQGASTSAVGGRLPVLLGARFGGLRAAPFGPPSSLATGTAPASRAWSWWTWTWSRRAGSSGSAVRVHRAANKGALKRPKARQLRRGLLALGPAGIPEPRPLLQRAASS